MRGGARSWAAALTVALFVYYFALALASNRASDDRHIVLLSLGSRPSSTVGSTSVDGQKLTLRADEATAGASWADYSYEIGHLLARARSCGIDVALVGLDVTSPNASGSADVLVNGNVVRHIAFSNALRDRYPFSPGRLVPANAEPRLVDLVPLDPEYAILVPVPRSYCSARTFTIGVRVHDATWTISRAAILLDYTPAPLSPALAYLAVALGAAVLAGLVGGAFLTLRSIATLGAWPLGIAAVVLVLSPLTFDQWDFRLWLNFSEIAFFGGGDPAYLWFGSPLWAFVPTVFASIAAGANAVSGAGGPALTAIAMKVAMGLAYCYVAYEIARRAPRRIATAYAAMALLLPVGLFELAAGYREIFATALAIAALVQVSRRRLAAATLLAVAAASISEEFLPMLFLPALSALVDRAPRAKRIATASALAAGSLILFLGEWKWLVPADVAGTAFRYRFGPAPLGGASWAGALDGFGLLPDWVPAHSPAFGALLFLAIALFPAAAFVRVLRKCASQTREKNFNDVAGIVVALVATFLIAFRGTDPNLWYSLSAIALWYFASANPLNPFPLVLGCVEGLAFYATVGFREFVNQAFFWPVDRGLLGILSNARGVFDLMVDALLLALIVAIWRDRTREMFSRQSGYCMLLFVSAVAATATASYPLDVVICGVAVALAGRFIFRVIAADRTNRTLPISPAAQAIVFALVLSAGAAFGVRSALAGMCVVATCLIAARDRLGACDAILAIGAVAVLAAQPGIGIVSVVGSVAVVAALAYAVFAVIAARTSRAFRWQRLRLRR